MTQNYGSTDIYESKENIQNLITRINNNLQNIRQITRDLHDLYSMLGGVHDTPQKRTKIVQSQKRAKDLLSLTKSLFDTIAQLKSNDEATKLTISKVKEDYENAVPKYNTIHQMILDKFTEMANDLRNQASVSLRSEEEQSIDVELLVKDDSELIAAENFNNRMTQIEHDLNIVQNLYIQINEIVAENKEAVQQIETNVEAVNENVDQANEQLSSAIIYKKKAFKKKICLILVVIIILAIIGLIIWLVVKNKNN